MPVVTEVGWVLKFAGPKTTMRGSRRIFVGNVIQRVFPEGDCLALLNHPPADIYAVHRTERDHPPVTVRVAMGAGDVAPADVLGERAGRVQAARIDRAVFSTTLRQLGTVDTPQSDARFANLDRVAVNHARDAGHGFGCIDMVGHQDSEQ